MAGLKALFNPDHGVLKAMPINSPRPNPLLPQSGGGADMSGNPDPSLGQLSGDPLAPLVQQNSMATAQLKKLDTMAELMKKTRMELDNLLDLGDLVDEEDVIRSVGKVVAAGGSPMALASMLADAPFGNKEALQQWVIQRDAGARQMEAQVEQARAQARHAAGLAGLKLLAGHSAQSLAQAPAQQPQTPGQGPDTGAGSSGSAPGLGQVADAGAPPLAAPQQQGG